MAPAMGNELQHRTVLLDEAVDGLITRADGIYMDGTFGRGGHSRAILQRLGEAGRLIAFAREEEDHLAWTAQRLKDLDSRPSLLNPLWYAGALAIGFVAGRFGDRASLGFMAETERQVEQHLDGHMRTLPATDYASRAIVEQMRNDESAHAAAAIGAGGSEMPFPVRALMRAASKVMTRTAYYI